jgi:hypothetical protein
MGVRSRGSGRLLRRMWRRRRFWRRWRWWRLQRRVRRDRGGRRRLGNRNPRIRRLRPRLLWKPLRDGQRRDDVEETTFGSGVGFLAVAYFGSQAFGAAATLLYSDGTTADLTIPVGVDITPATPNTALAASFDTGSSTVAGLWSTEGGSITFHLVSATPSTKCATSAIACFAVHGTLHAVLVPDATQGTPGQGTVTMDVVF